MNMACGPENKGREPHRAPAVIFACACPTCVDDGMPCTNLAPDNEDLCDECALCIHEIDREDDR